MESLMDRELKRVESEGEGEGEECWISNFPSEIKELIFSNLLVESFFISRAVCKEWNHIISSLLAKSCTLLTYNPWLLIWCGFTNGENYHIAFNFLTGKWMTISLSFLLDPQVCSNPDNRVESSMGLLLFQQQLDVSQLLICNPIMRSCANIEIDLMREERAQIVRGQIKEPYVAVWKPYQNISFKIYEYFKGSWKLKSQLAVEDTGSNVQCFDMVECNDVLFWGSCTPCGIMGYNIKDEGLIKPVRVAPLPLEMRKDLDSRPFFPMFSYGSSVLVVGNFENHGGNQPSFGSNKTLGVVIWELFQDEKDKMFWKWKEFARIHPESLPIYFDHEEDLDYTYWICVGDYLCFCNPLKCLRSTVFAYNLKEGFCQTLPPCKPLYDADEKGGFWMGSMMSFEPSSLIISSLDGDSC